MHADRALPSPHPAGVRYPTQLLGEVQAMLLSQQEQQQRLATVTSGGLPAAAGPAAAGQPGVAKVESPTPVNPALLKKAFRSGQSLPWVYAGGLEGTS
jgi:hypothetical protein